jgi:hypothetical protein
MVNDEPPREILENLFSALKLHGKTKLCFTILVVAIAAARNIWSAAPTAVACFNTRCLVLG